MEIFYEDYFDAIIAITGLYIPDNDDIKNAKVLMQLGRSLKKIFTNAPGMFKIVYELRLK